LEKYQKNTMARAEIAGDLGKNNPSDAAMVVVASAMLNMDEWLNKN
jgi:hypothetical protein